MRLLRAVQGSLRTNTYLIVTENECVIIDPSVPTLAESSLLHRECKEKRVLVLVTHNHFDHTGGAAELRRRLGALIAMNMLDKALWNVNTYMARALNAEGEYEPFFDVDLPLTDGYVIQTSGGSIRAIHTPGHTPGHMVYLIENQDKLFSGDLLFRGGYGRCDLPFSSCEDLSRSIARIGEIIPAGARVYPGHGAPFRFRPPT